MTIAKQPDGGYVKTTYQGLTVSAYQHVIRIDGSLVNEVGTTVKNDLGQPASVTDAMGSTNIRSRGCTPAISVIPLMFRSASG